MAAQVYDALNTLGAVPWRINRPVLEVVERAWAAQMRIAKLPVNIPKKAALHPAPKAKRFRTARRNSQLCIQVITAPRNYDLHWKPQPPMCCLELVWLLRVEQRRSCPVSTAVCCLPNPEIRLLVAHLSPFHGPSFVL